jgi:DNA-directed RNA polymerase subunit RPC12/RpoP
MSDEETARCFKEFDCPECTANNPLDEGFKIGDEVQCASCGILFKVRPASGGKFKLEQV